MRFNLDDSVKFSELDSLPTFYIEVLRCFGKVQCTGKVEFEENILNQCLWGNKFITKEKW